MSDDLKIKAKVEDCLAWSYVALRQFPKHERHVLAAEIRTALWRLREGCVKRIRRRLKSLARRYHDGRATLGEVEAVVAAWLGHARHADAARIAEMVLAELVLVPQRRREACGLSLSSET